MYSKQLSEAIWAYGFKDTTDCWYWILADFNKNTVLKPRFKTLEEAEEYFRRELNKVEELNAE